MARILVIDDDQDIARTTAMMLTSGGHQTETELNAKNAIKKVGEFKPDLIVLDVMFPDNSTAGFELAREIRTKFNLPVVMVSSVNQMTGFKFTNKEIDKEWLPVNEFVEKPIKKEKLLDLVKKLTAGK